MLQVRLLVVLLLTQAWCLQSQTLSEANGCHGYLANVKSLASAKVYGTVHILTNLQQASLRIASSTNSKITNINVYLNTTSVTKGMEDGLPWNIRRSFRAPYQTSTVLQFSLPWYNSSKQEQDLECPTTELYFVVKVTFQGGKVGWVGLPKTEINSPKQLVCEYTCDDNDLHHTTPNPAIIDNNDVDPVTTQSCCKYPSEPHFFYSSSNSDMGCVKTVEHWMTYLATSNTSHDLPNVECTNARRGNSGMMSSPRGVLAREYYSVFMNTQYNQNNSFYLNLPRSYRDAITSAGALLSDCTDYTPQQQHRALVLASRLAIINDPTLAQYSVPNFPHTMWCSKKLLSRDDSNCPCRCFSDSSDNTTFKFVLNKGAIRTYMVIVPHVARGQVPVIEVNMEGGGVVGTCTDTDILHLISPNSNNTSNTIELSPSTKVVRLQLRGTHSSNNGNILLSVRPATPEIGTQTSTEPVQSESANSATTDANVSNNPSLTLALYVGLPITIVVIAVILLGLLLRKRHQNVKNNQKEQKQKQKPKTKSRYDLVI